MLIHKVKFNLTYIKFTDQESLIHILKDKNSNLIMRMSKVN